MIGVYHHATFHPIRSGRVEFMNDTLETIVAFLRQGHEYEYYLALERTLMMMRGSVVTSGPVLGIIEQWPIDPMQTTILLSYIAIFAVKYGYCENDQPEVTQEQEIEDQIIPAKDIGTMIEENLSSLEPDEQEFVATEVVPRAVQLLRIWLCTPHDRKFVAFFDGIDVVKYLRQFIPIDIESSSGSPQGRYNLDGAPAVSLKDWVARRNNSETIIVWLERHSPWVDKLITRFPAARVLVIGNQHMWFKTAMSPHTLGNFVGYSRCFPCSWKRVARRQERERVITDFLRPDRVYRINTKADRQQMLAHLHFGSAFCVSSKHRSLLGGFPAPYIKEVSKTDVSFVSDGFDASTEYNVSYVTGRSYHRKIFPYVGGDVHALEGSLIKLPDMTYSTHVVCESGNRWIHCVESQRIVTRYQKNGRVYRVSNNKVFVYSRDLLKSPFSKWFSQKDFGRIPENFLL